LTKLSSYSLAARSFSSLNDAQPKGRSFINGLLFRAGLF